MAKQEYTLDYAKDPPSYKTYIERAKKSFPQTQMIDETEFVSITNKPCHYCGKEGPNGIDRVDNKIGYTTQNCKPCCKHCNYVKGALSVKDFNTWKQRFVAHQNSQ